MARGQGRGVVAGRSRTPACGIIGSSRGGALPGRVTAYSTLMSATASTASAPDESVP